MATKQSKKKQQEVIDEAKDRLKAAIEAEQDNREASVEDVQFENGEQWDDNAKADREEDGRPVLVVNKVAGTVKQIVGDARQNRFSVKVRPVDDQSDPQVAEIFNGLIRNIENVSEAESAYDNAFECAVRGGWGYWRITTDYMDDATFDQEIRIDRVTNPYAVYFDPHAKQPDLSDAQWCQVSEMMSKDEFERRYPDAVAENDFDQGFGDRDPDWATDDTVRVVEYFKKERTDKTLLLLSDGRTVDADELETQDLETMKMAGLTVVRERTAKTHKVTWCKLTDGAVLEGPQDWAGKYIPVVPVFGEEVWIHGKKVLRSAIRFAKDPQRLYNWARSTAAETMAMAPKQPWLATPDQIDGHEEQWEVAHRKPMPYLLYNEGGASLAPQRQQASIPDSGALQEAVQSADDIKATTGLFDAALGQRTNETSGRAILARQKEGDTSTYVFTDNLARAIKYTGKILVDLIPKIYDTERVVRLLNQDGSEGWAEINKTLIDPLTGEETSLNDVSKGRYDVVVATGPNYNTKRMEAADGMVQMVQAAPMTAQVVLPRLAKNLDWPEADEIAKELEAILKPQQQEQDPRMAMQAQKMQMDLQKTAMELKKSVMEMQGKAQEQELQNDHQQLQNVGQHLDNIKAQMELAGMEQKQIDQMMQELQTSILQGINQ